MLASACQTAIAVRFLLLAISTLTTPILLAGDPQFCREQLVDCWSKYISETAQDGDILFALGDARVAGGFFRFSKFFAKLTDSKFSHTGLLSHENGRVFVYDMTPEGTRRTCIHCYMAKEHLACFAIKRLKPEHRSCIPAAIDYCKNVHATSVPFDLKFKEDDTSLYCTEMTEKSFRAGGIVLSEPVRIDCLPRYRRCRCMAGLCRMVGGIQPCERVFIPGNDNIGLWSSPCLDLICEADDPLEDVIRKTRESDKLESCPH